MNDMDIIKKCKDLRITNYSIDNGIVNVDGDVYINFFNINTLPLNFGTVSGVFDCSNNYLTSLKGAPHYVGKYFDCDSNLIKTLDLIPETNNDKSFRDNSIFEIKHIDGYFNMMLNPAYHIYKYICDFEGDFMKIVVDIDYFIDYKILIGKDIYLKRFEDFLNLNGLDSCIDINSLKKAKYKIK